MAKSTRLRAKGTTATKPAKNNALQDGTLAFPIVGGEHDGDTLTLDVMHVRLACEIVERKHDVYAKGYTCTLEFFGDLAEAIKSCGATYCTPTMAYQIWTAVIAEWEKLKKNMP